MQKTLEKGEKKLKNEQKVKSHTLNTRQSIGKISGDQEIY